MSEEVRSILNKETWSIVNRPCNRSIVGSRFVLRNKYSEDGAIERRKARIVTKGYSQRPGLDFHATFAPVARMGSIRMIVALAAQLDMEIHHVDVTTAYLNGILQEEIYMELPQHLISVLERLKREGDSATRTKAAHMLDQIQRGDTVCKLHKALYGLRQAGRCWHEILDNALKTYGATNSSSDPCVYYIGQGKDIILIATYVDDIVMAARDPRKIAELKRFLSAKFEFKNSGEIKRCLGIEFLRDQNGIHLRQSALIREILHRFDMFNCKPKKTPLEPGIKLERDDQKSGEELPYRELVGSLMYLSVCTRPDIFFAVSYLSQFNDCFGEAHWKAAKRVLRYLKGTELTGLTFPKCDGSLTAYVDADWANCPLDRRSYTGFTFQIGRSIVSWESRKQRTVALSSTEAEYMALCEATKEAICLRRSLIEFGFEKMAKTILFCDSNGARMLAENPVHHNRSKHIDTRHHFVRDAVHGNQVTIKYIPTDEMATDALTKPLAGPKLRKCLRILGIE